MHIEGAIEEIKGLEANIEDTRKAVVSRTLVPLPGESVRE